MSNEVVLDIETQNSFADVGGANHDKLKISLVGVYWYETDAYESFLEPDLPTLWAKLERSGRIIGYNTKGFDYLVMNAYYPGDFSTFPSLDLLELIAKVLGFRVKLDDVAQATLGIGKSGHGLLPRRREDHQGGLRVRQEERFHQLLRPLRRKTRSPHRFFASLSRPETR
jgi:hypothetical protein